MSCASNCSVAGFSFSLIAEVRLEAAGSIAAALHQIQRQVKTCEQAFTFIQMLCITKSSYLLEELEACSAAAVTPFSSSASLTGLDNSFRLCFFAFRWGLFALACSTLGESRPRPGGKFICGHPVKRTSELSAEAAAGAMQVKFSPEPVTPVTLTVQPRVSLPAHFCIRSQEGQISGIYLKGVTHVDESVQRPQDHARSLTERQLFGLYQF